METGLLRLETTFYIDNNAVSEEYIGKYLNYLFELLRKELIYHNLINKQWRSILNQLEYNILVENFDNKSLCFLNLLTMIVKYYYFFFLHFKHVLLIALPFYFFGKVFKRCHFYIDIKMLVIREPRESFYLSI